MRISVYAASGHARIKAGGLKQIRREHVRFLFMLSRVAQRARVMDDAFPFSPTTGAHFRVGLCSATNRDEYNGVPGSHYRAAAEQERRAYTFDWIIRNRPPTADRRSPPRRPDGRNRFPRLDREMTWTCNLNCIFAWAVIIEDRPRGASQNCATARAEVMVRADRDSCQIDLARSMKYRRRASHRDDGREWSKGGAGLIPIRILQPFFDYHSVPQFHPRFASAKTKRWIQWDQSSKAIVKFRPVRILILLKYITTGNTNFLNICLGYQ